MIQEISTITLKSIAPVIFKDVTTFIKSKYSKQSALNKLSEDNHELVSSISKFMYVKTLATGADVPKNLFDFFQKPKLNFNKNNFFVEHIGDIKKYTNMDNYNNIIFEGTVGQGKSIFLRSLFIQDFVNNSRIPVFIELKNISNKKNLMTLIKDYLSVWIGSDQDVLNIVLKSGKVSIFLDAFDEIDLDLLEDTHTEIDLLVKSYPSLNVIITSRPDTIILNNPNFYTISLCAYGKEEQEGLIDKIVADDDNKKILKDSISVSSFEVSEVLKTPLMVILYVKQYEVGFSVPQHVSDFYKNIFDVVTFTHDKSKGIEKRKSFSSLSQNQLENVFQRFCFELFLTGKTVFDKNTFTQLLERSVNKSLIKTEIDYSQLINDYTRFACLILKDGLKFTFIHKSIMEYYVANFISELTEARAEEVLYRKFLNIKTGIFILMESNIVDFLSVIKPYFYNKYYFIKGLVEYEKLFDVKFCDDELNFNKFLDNLYILNKQDFNDLSRGSSKRREGTRFSFLAGESDIVYKLIVKRLRPIIQYSYENNIVDLTTLNIRTTPYHVEIIKSKDEFKRVKEVIKDPVVFEKLRSLWSDVCLEIDSIKNTILELESSVLSDDLDF